MISALMFFCSSVQAQVIPGCSLSITLTLASGNTSVPGLVSYVAKVKNAGTQVCKNTKLSISYAKDESFVSISPFLVAGDGFWKLNGINPGKTSTITINTNRLMGLQQGQTPSKACVVAANGVNACTLVQGALFALPQIPTIEPVLNSITHAEYGVWYWTPVTQMSATDMKDVIASAVDNHFNAMYLTIDDYVEIDMMAPGSAKDIALDNYQQLLNTFLTLAAQNNIAVDAEAGASNWVLPEYAWRSRNILTFVADYNKSHANKFRGVQFDIEPYLLPGYEDNPAPILTQYIQMVQMLATVNAPLQVPLSFDIPHFYDSVLAWTPKITVDGVSDYTYGHLLRILNQLPNSSILIMAYRNYAEGAGGTNEIAGAEILQANATNVKVIVGQETGNVDPAYVTFYGTSKSYLASQIAIINQTFQVDSSFGGIAVHYMDPFLQLKP